MRKLPIAAVLAAAATAGVLAISPGVSSAASSAAPTGVSRMQCLAGGGHLSVVTEGGIDVLICHGGAFDGQFIDAWNAGA